MIEKIYEYKLPQAECSDEENNSWEQVRRSREAQAAALATLKGTDAAAFRNIIAHMLSTGRNDVFSPCAIYVGLLTLAGFCSGKSKKEILSAVFGTERRSPKTIEAIKTCVTGDMQTNDGSLSASVWINDRAALFADAIREVCQTYGADAFCGTMGTAEMDAAIQEWVNARTGNLLARDVGDIKTTKDTVLELLITTYFKAKWVNRFWEGNTERETFHTDAQTEVLCDFMKKIEHMECVRTHQFTAVAKKLFGGYEMWFIRPNDGVNVTDLAGSETLTKLLVHPERMTKKKMEVTLSIPKFDVASKVDMKDTMRAMGIKGVFDDRTLPFAEISADPRLFLSKADHAARVKISEEGVEAAAYVDFGMAAGCIPPVLEKMEFKLDKPFFFVISKGGKLPLYIGTVADPTAV